MTKEERDILIEIRTTVIDMKEGCAQERENIADLYKRTEKNANNIARIAGGVVAITTLITIVIAVFK